MHQQGNAFSVLKKTVFKFHSVKFLHTGVELRYKDTKLLQDGTG